MSKNAISQSHLIFSNAVIMWLTRILMLFPQLFLVSYLIRTIGDKGYGAYALVWPLMLSIEQLQRSLQSGVVKYCAEFIARKRIDEVNKIVSSSFIYSLLLALFVSLCTFAASIFYKETSRQLSSMLCVVGIMSLFIFPITPYLAVIQSQQRYYVGAIAETVSKYLGLLVIVVWFSFVDPSAQAVVIILATALFFSRLVQVFIAYRMIPGLRNRLSLFDRKSFKLITSFGAATVLASLCLVANTTGIRWLMDALESTSFVAYLVIMWMPSLLLSQIIGAATITVMPATSTYEAAGKHRTLQDLLLRGTRYTMILSLAGMIVAALLMRNVLDLWVGSEFVFLTPYALALFVGQVFMQGGSVSHHMLKGMGKLREVVVIYTFSLAVLPIVVILCVFYMWHDPFLAVTSGLLLGYFACGYLNFFVCTRLLNINLYQAIFYNYFKPLFVAIIVGLVVFGIVVVSDMNDLFGRISLLILVAMPSFLISSYFFLTTGEEKQQIKNVFLRLKKVTLRGNAS